MKKINVGLVALLISFASISFAASNSTSKNEVAAPYYNGGFSFGLASYSSKPSTNISDLNPSAESAGNNIDEVQVGAI